MWFREAILQGADYIKCDVEITKDLKLVCSHEPWISEIVNMTNYPQFKDRKSSYEVNDDDPDHDWNDKGNITDWFIWDFDLTDLQTMKRRQRNLIRDQSYNDKETFCTFEEFIDVAQEVDAGICVEIKHGNTTDKILGSRNHTTKIVDLIVDVCIRLFVMTQL